MTFKPADFKPVTRTKLSDLITQLDHRFRTEVADGYYTEESSSHIQLIFGLGSRTEQGIYNDLLSLRSEVTEYYLSLGWSSAVVQTSEENGERPGLISIKLVK